MKMIKLNFFTFFLGLLFFAIASCKKHDNDILNADKGFEGKGDSYLPNTENTWWKYEWYRIDSLGNEFILPEKDCVYVVADTIINGYPYIHLQGTYFGSFDLNQFWRDSSYYLISFNGYKAYRFDPQLDTLDEYLNHPNYNIYKITHGVASSITVEGNSYLAFERESQVRSKVGGFTLNICEDTVIQHYSYFSIGIGEILEQTPCIYAIDPLNQNNVININPGAYCGYLEKRLVDYHIMP